MVTYVGYGGNYRHIKFAFQTFLDNLHVQHSQETTTKSKSKCSTTFWGKYQRSIIQLQFFHRRTEFFIIFRINRVYTRKYHWFNIFKASNRIFGWASGVRNGIAYFYLPGIFDPGNKIAHVPGFYTLFWMLYQF